MIVSSAPGRCGIIGNPTDMYGGSVISCSTTQRARCTLMNSDVLTLGIGNDVQQIRSPRDLLLDGTRLDIVKAILNHFKLTPDEFTFRLLVTSEIPESAGLAGSTAMVMAILGCVTAHLGIEMGPYSAAETARKVEFGEMGIMCGFQDQYMAAFGGLNYMDFRGKERLAQDQDEPLATVEALEGLVGELPIVVAHTGITRNSGTVHGCIRDRWLAGEREVVDGYIRIAELARLGKKAILASDWERLGALMNENHEIQRALGGSGPQNDYLIEAALANGAIGAKLAGAGGGGTIVALTLQPDRVVRALRGAGADSISWPKPCEGLVVEQVYSSPAISSCP